MWLAFLNTQQIICGEILAASGILGDPSGGGGDVGVVVWGGGGWGGGLPCHHPTFRKTGRGVSRIINISVVGMGGGGGGGVNHKVCSIIISVVGGGWGWVNHKVCIIIISVVDGGLGGG